MSSKLKIDFSAGQLEVEGSEELVKEIYSDFKNELNNIPKKATPKASSNKSSNKSNSKGSSSKSSTRSKSSSKSNSDSLTLVSDLNLYPKNAPSLKDFVAQFKSPKKGEIYLLCIQYLNDILKLDSVTVNHVYTCLKELSVKVPTTLKQQMINLSNSHGWIETSNMDKITVTIKGDNQLNHNMEKTTDDA